MSPRAQRFCPGVRLLLAPLLLLAGCEEDWEPGRGADSPLGVLGEPNEGPAYRYLVEVSVTSLDGYYVSAATVELIVASVPEQRLVGFTDADGCAWFEVYTAPEVPLVAYVSAVGFMSNAGDVGTYAGAQVLHIPVCLRPRY